MSRRSGKPWIPRPDAEYNKFYKKYRMVVMKYCTGSDPIWIHIPSARVTELSTAYSNWAPPT
jgi:hypothetical protein